MFEFKTAKAKCLLSCCSVQCHGWVDVPGIDCTSMLIVRTWFPNSFLRMLVCCLIWLQMFHCLGTQGEIGGRKSAVVLAQWHFGELQHHIPDGIHLLSMISSETPRKMYHRFCYSYLSPLLLSHASEMLCFPSSWIQLELQTFSVS